MCFQISLTLVQNLPSTHGPPRCRTWSCLILSFVFSLKVWLATHTLRLSSDQRFVPRQNRFRTSERGKLCPIPVVLKLADGVACDSVRQAAGGWFQNGMHINNAIGV